jgi:hypothetical protein
MVAENLALSSIHYHSILVCGSSIGRISINLSYLGLYKHASCFFWGEANDLQLLNLMALFY